MVEIPEHLLLRSAEARAKALGISIEQALAEMKGEVEPTVVEKVVESTIVEKTEIVKTEEIKPTSNAEQEQENSETKEEVVEEKKDPVAETEKPEVEEVDFAPETKVTQRLLTVVKADPIQKSTSEPVDKVNVWPHLMLPEFIAVMAMTAFLILLSAILRT